MCYVYVNLSSLQADIVAQSKIIFQEKELLQLIHAHLVNKGTCRLDKYEVQSESSRTVPVGLFVFKEESQNFAHLWENHFSPQQYINLGAFSSNH